MKYVLHACANKDCVCYTEWNGSCSHKLLGTGEGGLQIVQCDKCGATSQREAPALTKGVKKRTYPYYNVSTGQTFESESHEKTYVKANNLDAI